MTWLASAADRKRRSARSESPLLGGARGGWWRSFESIDLGVLLLLFVAPLFFGGRDDLGRWVFSALTSATALAWLLAESRRSAPRWTPSRAYLAVGAAALLGALQLVALPAPLVNWLAPRTYQLLPTWSPTPDGNIRLGVWPTLSLAPAQGRIALAMALSYATLFVVVAQRLRSVDDVWRLLQGMGLASLAICIFGLVHYFLSNGLYLWFYEVADRTKDHAPVGPFFNRNHFAHFVALGVPVFIAWLLQASIRPVQRPRHGGFAEPQTPTISFRQGALALALAMVAFGVMLSMSRGGALVLLIAAGSLCTFLWLKGLVSGAYLGRLSLVGAAVTGLLFLHGFDDVVGRLDDFAAGSLDELDQSSWRRKIWTANCAAFQAGWTTGAGAGTHAEIYPVYFPQSTEFEFTHAESSVLQIATEFGLPGLVLLGVGGLLVAFWCWSAFRQASDRASTCCAAVISAALLASVFHACVDFVWHIPACMTLTVLLLAAALRLYHLTRPLPERTVALSPFRWTATATVIIAFGVWSVGTLWGPALASPHWNRYRLMHKAAAAAKLQQWHEGLATSPTNHRQQNDFYDQAMIDQLRRVVQASPGHSRAHLRLAQLYLQRFDALQQDSDNAMTAENVRDAAISSQFASAGELREWMQRAFGQNALFLYQARHHVRQALRLGPLQGKAYLTLAQLSHLEGWNQGAVDVLVDQARRLRPQDGDVLFEVGRRRASQGNLDEALNLWSDAYGDSGDHQRQIIRLLAGNWPASEFLRQFQPTWSTLRDVWLRYREQGSAEDLNQIVDYAILAAESQAADSVDDANQVWMRLVEMCSAQGRSADALRASQRAFRAAPDEPRIRLALAQQLVEANDPRAAEGHLRWYLARRPGDAYAEKLLLACAKAKISTPPAVAARPQ